MVSYRRKRGVLEVVASCVPAQGIRGHSLRSGIHRIKIEFNLPDIAVAIGFGVNIQGVSDHAQGDSITVTERTKNRATCRIDTP